MKSIDESVQLKYYFLYEDKELDLDLELRTTLATFNLRQDNNVLKIKEIIKVTLTVYSVHVEFFYLARAAKSWEHNVIEGTKLEHEVK